MFHNMSYANRRPGWPNPTNRGLGLVEPDIANLTLVAGHGRLPLDAFGRTARQARWAVRMARVSFGLGSAAADADGGKRARKSINSHAAMRYSETTRPSRGPLRRPTRDGTTRAPVVSRLQVSSNQPEVSLYLKTKNFHWHVSGPHFRDYHLLLDEQGEQIFGTTDELAERVRKIGGRTLRSIGHIAKLQRIRDNDAEFVDPADMLLELMRDNKAVVHAMREAHEVADKHDDVGTASLLETSSMPRRSACGSCSRLVAQPTRAVTKKPP
jgi:starvation-inducible DNA-binding protein